MQLPISITLRPSRRLAVSLALAHGIAVAVVFTLTLPTIMRLALLVAIMASLALAFRSQLHHPLVRLHLGAGGELGVETKIGVRETVSIAPGTLALPGLILLFLRLSGGPRVLVLPTDAMAAESHRRLRTWLKWRATFG